MPNLPDIPGKGLITGMTNRTRVVVGAAGTGALALGGVVVRRLLDHRGGDDPNADPIAETPTAPPGAEEKPVPKPKPAKPKTAKPKPPKAKKPKGPHHALNNPVVDDPDMTEYPDPYDTREDPLADPTTRRAPGAPANRRSRRTPKSRTAANRRAATSSTTSSRPRCSTRTSPRR